MWDDLACERWGDSGMADNRTIPEKQIVIPEKQVVMQEVWYTIRKAGGHKQNNNWKACFITQALIAV